MWFLVEASHSVPFPCEGRGHRAISEGYGALHGNGRRSGGRTPGSRPPPRATTGGGGDRNTPPLPIHNPLKKNKKMIRYITLSEPSPRRDVRTRSVVVPADCETPIVTREEYDALLARVAALEALLAANTANTPANIANASANAVSTTANAANATANAANTDRKAYMRDLMRRRRAAASAAHV